MSAPFSKLLLNRLSPTFLAALLYLGAGLGMAVLSCCRPANSPAEKPLARADILWLSAMVLLDIAAPVLLLFGLKTATPATVSLLNNFEIAATALIAGVWFKEKVSRRLWAAILFITTACILLTVEDFSALAFSGGAVLALLACVCWGFENNTTRVLSGKNPLQTVMVKGFGSGLGALLLAVSLREVTFPIGHIAGALTLGAFAYGASVYCYIRAQRQLGAARTGIYYAFAPFIGVALSFMLVGQPLGVSFCAALAIMLAGTYLAVSERTRN